MVKEASIKLLENEPFDDCTFDVDSSLDVGGDRAVDETKYVTESGLDLELSLVGREERLVLLFDVFTSLLEVVAAPPIDVSAEEVGDSVAVDFVAFAKTQEHYQSASISRLRSTLV